VPGPRILVSENYTFPDSLGSMGFDLKDSGFHILLSKDVPEMIGEKIEGLVDGSSRATALLADQIRAGFCIPGGSRCWHTWKKHWPEQVRYAAVMGCSRQRGKSFQRHYPFYFAGVAGKAAPQKGDIAMAAAFGPGFSAEFLSCSGTKHAS